MPMERVLEYDINMAIKVIHGTAQSFCVECEQPGEQEKPSTKMQIGKQPAEDRMSVMRYVHHHHLAICLRTIHPITILVQCSVGARIRMAMQCSLLACLLANKENKTKTSHTQKSTEKAQLSTEATPIMSAESTHNEDQIASVPSLSPIPFHPGCGCGGGGGNSQQCAKRAYLQCWNSSSC